MQTNMRIFMAECDAAMEDLRRDFARFIWADVPMPGRWTGKWEVFSPTGKIIAVCTNEEAQIAAQRLLSL